MNEKVKAILVVEDDNDFRKMIAGILEERGFQVYEATHGKEAVSLIGPQKIDLIISDIKMPIMHGIELLHYLRANFAHIPVALMTGFNDIISIKEAYEIGAKGFLSKPFSTSDFESILSEILGWSPCDQNVDSKRKLIVPRDEYCEIPIDEFISGSKIQFPIYLKLSNTKMVKVANQGEDISAEMLKRLKTKGIRSLYMLTEDYRNYIKFITKLAVQVQKTKKIDPARKKKFYQNNAKHLLQLGLQETVNPDLFHFARSNLEMTISIYMDHADYVALMDEMLSMGGDIYGHSLSVSLLSVMLAKQLGWSSPETVFLISSAGLFHDIGKREMAPELIRKKEVDMSEDELLVYREHPRIGAEVLENIGGAPDGIVQIILHHHENVDGSGYPSGIGRVRIHPVAKIINLVDQFLHRSEEMKDLMGKAPKPASVFANMEEDNIKFEADYWRALENVFEKNMKASKLKIS